MLPLVVLAYMPTAPSEAAAQEEQLIVAGNAHDAIVVREHAGWNKGCEALAPPALYLSEPPRHGKVCARVENIRISSMYVGTESHCIGRRVDGVQLIYRAAGAYAGDDGLRYAVQYPSVRRTIAVKVTVTAYASGVSGAAPSSVVAPIPPIRQSAGPVPFCADTVF